MLTSAIVMLVVTQAAASPPENVGTLSVIGIGPCSNGRLPGDIRGLRESLSKRLDAAVQSDEETHRRLGGVSRSSLADVDRVFSAARYDLDSMAYDRAEQTLRLAADDLIALPPSPDRSQRLRQLLPLLAWAYLKLENQPAAERIFERILRVDPEFALGRKQFPPSTHRVFEKTRTRVKTQATARLAITTRPAGLPVFVDGREVGKAPVFLHVPPGVYRIEADFGQGRGLPRTWKVEAETSVELDERFEGSIFPLAGPCVDAGDEPAAQLTALTRLATILETRTLVAIRHEKSGAEAYLVAQRLDSASGRETRKARVRLTPTGVPANALDHLADFLVTGDAATPIEPLLGDASSFASAADLPTTGATVRKQRFRIASYALGGIAAVSLGLSGYYFLSANSAKNDMSALRNAQGNLNAGTEGQYKDLVHTRHQRQTIGTATLAAGTATAMAGVVAFLMSRDGPPSSATVRVAPGSATLVFQF